MKTNPEIFTFSELEEGIYNIRDFQTAGVVSAARGCPLSELKAGRLDLLGKRVAVKADYKQNCIESIGQIINKLNVDF